ncbi:MAG: polysaccharide biosynthesis protein [Planctomycetes bacterium GWF2_50_10]|nr:MAG: polysaccharide biosynthesis protein [Planctomycetes bacterium GWF2_50_10]
MIHLSRPDITEKEIAAVVEVLKSNSLSLGPKVPEFEAAIAKYVGRKYGVAVNSGTTALYLSLLAMGIKPGDEIITTPFTFIASTNCILMAGAKPVYVDIDPTNLNIDPARIEAAITPKTKAILPVIVFGNAWGFDKIVEIAKKHNLPILEDSCEGLGTIYKGTKVGGFGRMSCFGFYPNKQVTTGEGGMILTDEQELVDICVSLRNQGRGKGGGWLAHERLGYNFRLPDINCALGVVQATRIDEFRQKRRKVAQMYQQLLTGEDRLITPQEPQGGEMSWFVFVIRLANKYSQTHRDHILKRMFENGVQVSNYFPPVHLQPFIANEYGYKPGDFPITDAVCQRTIALPFHNNLPESDAKTVVATLKKCLDEADSL